MVERLDQKQNPYETSNEKNYDMPRDLSDKKKPTPTNAKVAQLESEIASL